MTFGTILSKSGQQNKRTNYTTIKLTCNGIGQNPEVRKEYDGISNNLLGLKSGKHIIFYKAVSDERIEIVRILHERMDLKKRIIE